MGHLGRVLGSVLMTYIIDLLRRLTRGGCSGECYQGDHPHLCPQTCRAERHTVTDTIRDTLIAPPGYTEPEHGSLPGDGEHARRLPLLIIAAWMVIGLALWAMLGCASTGSIGGQPACYVAPDQECEQ